MIRRPPRPPIKMMQPIALDLANSVTLLQFLSCQPSAKLWKKFFMINYTVTYPNLDF